MNRSMKKQVINFYIILLFIFFTNQVRSFDKDLPNYVSDTIRILTIGNSFADNACKYLKQITESVKGCNIIIGKANIGGCNLEKHADLIRQSELDPVLKTYNGKTLKEWLLTDEWDIVTIQQVSHLSYKAESYQPYADEIRDYVNKFASQAKIYIHETWAYAPDCPRLYEFGITSDQMYQGLRKNYQVLSERYDSKVLPSGDAFNRSLEKRKELDLWSSKDRFHANNNGCYLAACVWFKELFGKSPKKIRYRPEELSKKTARFLRRVASK